MTPSCLVPRIEHAATLGRGVVFITKDGPVDVPWAQVHEEAKSAAAELQARGIRPGDHVCLLGPTSRGLVTAVQAIWLAGACVVVLPLPMRMASIDEFVEQTRNRIRNADGRLLLIDPDLAAFYEPTDADPPMVGLEELTAGRLAPSSWVRPDDDPDRLAILQFTSGSTSEPKGVMLPHRVIASNLDGMIEWAELDPRTEVMVSWLPLYHDMGLVGFLTLSMTTGCRLVLASPQDFLAHPLHWMEWISTYGGTATAGPNFSWVLATRALRRGKDLDLSSLRIALNGAEPVDPDAVEAFVEAAMPFGFRPGAEFCAFGMAEVAIAGTFPPPMRGMRVDCVDRLKLEHERVAKPADPGLPTTRRLPVLGFPIPGLEVRIVDPDRGTVLDEREVGELEIRGTSVTTGYYKRPEATAALLRDGWLRTGDLAYLLDGELVLCGRIKDVIIVGGRNIFPEDIERAVGAIEGVRAGNVIAFGMEGYKGKESVVVVAEVRDADIDAVRRAVHSRVLDVSGVPPRDVILVRPGSLPKTSSGKPQRSLCRQRYLEESLPVAP